MTDGLNGMQQVTILHPGMMPVFQTIFTQPSERYAIMCTLVQIEKEQRLAMSIYQDNAVMTLFLGREQVEGFIKDLTQKLQEMPRPSGLIVSQNGLQQGMQP